MPRPVLLDSVASPDPPGDSTLARLTEHVRALLPVDAVAIVTARRFAGWFADQKLGEALGGDALAAARADLVHAALGRERPFFLSRLDMWETSPVLLAGLVDALGPEHARSVWRACRRASVIACPLRAESGRELGLLAVASIDPRERLRAADVRTAEVVADLAAMALERGDRARDEVFLKRASEAMSSSLELTDVYRSVVEHAAETTGATQAVLTRHDARAGELRTAAVLHPPATEALSGPGLAQVVRTRSPLLEREAGLMHAPIELGPRLYGVLSVAGPPGFDEAALELLTLLASGSAAAIANAIDFQRERHIARSLTLGFVPPSLPQLPGYETGLLYAPALGEATGGDLYGLWQLPCGHVAMLVGDVAGKGVETAALSSMVRFFIEARSWDAESPARVLEQTNAMLTGRLPSDTFATAFLAVMGPRSLKWASAGHLPPFHLAGGELSELAATGVPLGVEEGARYQQRTLELGDGDLVFAYTDGLVEARREAEVFGAGRLARLVARLAARHGPEQLAKRVHEEVVAWAGGVGDDVVALAVRRR